MTETPGLFDSIARYEAALSARFGEDLDREALAEKHAAMREDDFLFLRATCWRWAECAPRLCPELAAAPSAPSVGDAHAGNFGLWRDAEDRLVWGVNDFDEAARLPYALDLVRLCASLLLAHEDHTAGDTAEALLDGYRRGLRRPRPFVLEGGRAWLRKLFEAGPKDRRRYWRKLAAPEASPEPSPEVPPGYAAPLRAALPAETERLRIFPRRAGTGGLGRPRFAALGRWRGGPVAAEIRGVTPSAWTEGREAGLAARIAAGRFRAPDPSLRLGETQALRRLSPNHRKLDFKEIERNLRGRLFAAMAADLAAIHADGGDVAAISGDLAGRPGRWLARAARDVADWTRDERDLYRRKA